MSAAPSIGLILPRVARRYDVRVADLRSPRRDRKAVWPRHVAMYLARDMAGLSYPAIGRALGRRDPATAAYGVRTVERRMAREPADAAAIDRLRAELASAAAAQVDADAAAAEAEATAAIDQILLLRDDLAALRAVAAALVARFDRLIATADRIAAARHRP